MGNNVNLNAKHMERNADHIPGCQIKTNAPKFGAFLHLLRIVAGDMSLVPFIDGNETNETLEACLRRKVPTL